MSKEDIKINVGQEKLSIKVPLITEEEIRYIDNNMETIVDTITKQIISDKDLAIAQHIIQKLQQENEANKKRIEELEEENKKKSVGIICLQEELENSISKAKVKEKIRSLDIKITYIENQYTNGGQNCNSEYLSLLYQKQILEELLKDGGEEK